MKGKTRINITGNGYGTTQAEISFEIMTIMDNKGGISDTDQLN